MTIWKKLAILEHFKTYNARIVNSIHYLYDLRKTIDQLYVGDREKAGIDESNLFYYRSEAYGYLYR